MANKKTPNQYSSGKDTFSDNLVGFQVVDGSSQMTNTSFAIDRIIPEKDSKTVHTQPFSEFLTLDTIQQEEQYIQSTSTQTVGTPPSKIKFYDSRNDGSKSLFGSLSKRLSVAVQNIIIKFPAALYVDISSPIKTTNLSADSIVYDQKTNTTEFQIQTSLLFNPFGVLLSEPKSSTKPESTNTIRNLYSSYTKYVLEISGVTYDIVNYTEPSTTKKIILNVNGNCFSGLTGYTGSYIIRPNNGIVEEFYNNLDELEIILLDRETIPKYQGKFRVPRDVNNGASTELITQFVTWPTSKDGWNVQIIGIDFDYYLEQLKTIGDEIDGYKSNLIVRFLTSPQLFEFDTEEKKAEAIFHIYGQSFDKVKKFIDNIAFMRNVSYDKINNVPDLLLKNLATTLGLSTISLYDEKSLQDSLYKRTDTQYIGLNLGKNLVESEYEFYRRLLVNLAYLYKTKGTRQAIEFFMKFIGAPEPMIRFDEYLYKVNGPIPKSNYESDIRDAIQGKYVSYAAEYSGGTYVPELGGYSGGTYVVISTTGSTTLTRDEYPVNENTGLPKGTQSSDGTIFFESGAGWYRKTLDHRSHDILDEGNSNLTGRTKTIKTMSKPFTYGEDYFDNFRTLPGLDYGFDLTGEIDNVKSEIVLSNTDSSYILNRKNINLFLSPDRAIDYDIYTKSRNLLLTFGTVTPQTGVTFAEFLTNIVSDVIKNSNVIKYKRYYKSLTDVYNDYMNSTEFTPYNYIKVNEFITQMSPYWTEIIDQFIPATTLWLGGNIIENGTFNRSKFRYKKPCTPVEFAETLFPDFHSMIEEDLETILGGGSVKGIDVAESNLRGLFIFSGLTYILYIDINGQTYSGTTDLIVNELFTGFTPTSDCTSLTSSTTHIPLICEYKDSINPDVDAIKSMWIDGIYDLVSQINSETSGTGVSLSVEFFTDIDGVEKIKFFVYNTECKDGEIVDFYFEPLYNTPKVSCDLRVEIETPNTVFVGPIDDCALKSDIYIKIINDNYDSYGGFVTGVEQTGTTYNSWPLNFYITSGSSCAICEGCDPNYTWSPYDSDTCYRIETTGATSPVNPIDLTGVTSSVYSSFGTRIFDQIYYAGGSGESHILLTTPVVWEYVSGSTIENGPLNRCALWTTDPAHGPMNKWLGFSKCLSGITETKTYYIGIAADNHYRLVFDGYELLNTTGDTENAQYRFKYWNIYPISIGNGDHILELYGLNRESIAGFGCEIYDNTLSELTGATQYEDLNVIFTSSGQTLATIVQTESGEYISSGYTCPSGYTYSPCSGLCVDTIYCDTIDTDTSCLYDEMNPEPILETASGCTYMLSGVTETDIYNIIISDASNCEQKIRIEGLQPQIVEVNGVSGYTIFPKIQYQTTHNFGTKKGTVVYKEINQVSLVVWENLRDALLNGDIIETVIEDVKVNDILISIIPKNPSEVSITEIKNALETNDSFDFTFNYNRIQVENIECLSSIKKSIINDEFVVLPTSKVYVYTNVNESLENVPFHFTYKYPEDLFIKSSLTPEIPCCEYPANYFETSDRLVNQYGYLIDVTGVTLNYCDGGIYYRITYVDASDEQVVLFNGDYSGSTRIIVAYEKEDFRYMNMNLQHYFTNAECTYIPTVEDLERIPCDVSECVPTDCTFNAAFTESELVGCLTSIEFIVRYDMISGTCHGGHTCNQAKFNLTANGVDLGLVNLNNAGGSDDWYNYPPGEDATTYLPSINYNRYNVIAMSPEQAEEISSNAIDGNVTFSLECAMPTYCHEDVTWIQMIRDGEIIYDGCPEGNFITLNPCTGEIII